MLQCPTSFIYTPDMGKLVGGLAVVWWQCRRWGVRASLGWGASKFAMRSLQPHVELYAGALQGTSPPGKWFAGQDSGIL